MIEKLTPKQRFFVAEYQIDFNGTGAAIRAGFSEKNASEIAYQLLQKTPVREALQRDMEERLRKVGIRPERILEEIARIAFFDIRKLYREDGTLKHPIEWDDQTAAAVARVETFEEDKGRSGDQEMAGHTKKVRVFDKVRALEILAKYLNLFPIGHQISDAKVHVTETKPLSTLELAAKIRYLLTIADEKMKQVEQVKQLEDKS